MLLGACANWTVHDTLQQATTSITLSADAAQTIWGQHHGAIEHNFILGSHPSDIGVIVYFLACMAGHVAVSAVLPSGALREAWQEAWTVAEAIQVGENLAGGIP